ncbi:MAG: MFS transporter [Candidatus Undinarchaeales archaeon]
MKHILSKRNTISLLAGFGTSVIFLLFPLYAESLGAGYELIGLIVSIYAASSAITFYFAGHFSDSRALRKYLICAGLLLMTGSALFHYMADSISILTLARIGYGLGLGLYTGPIIAYVGRKGSRKKIGSFLGYYALGWGAGVFTGGYLTNILNFNTLFALFSIPSFAAFLVSLTIPKQNISRIEIPLFPVELIKDNSKLFSSFFLRNLTAQAIWMIMPLYVVSSLGGSSATVSYLFGINSIVQFFVMNAIVRFKFKDVSLVKFGFISSVIVFVLIALATSVKFLIPVFFLLGIVWATLYVGSNNYLIKNNKEKATLAGLLQSSRSMGIIIGPAIAGVLLNFYGFRYTILLLTIISVIAALIGVMIKE